MVYLQGVIAIANRLIRAFLVQHRVQRAATFQSAPHKSKMSGPKCFGYEFKDPELLALLDRQHVELRFAKFSEDIGQ